LQGGFSTRHSSNFKERQAKSLTYDWLMQDVKYMPESIEVVIFPAVDIGVLQEIQVTFFTLRINTNKV